MNTKRGRKKRNQQKLLLLHLIRVAVPAQNDIWLANWLPILSKIYFTISFVSKLYLLPTDFLFTISSQPFQYVNVRCSSSLAVFENRHSSGPHDVITAPAACLYVSSKNLIFVHKQTAELRSPTLGKRSQLSQFAT